MFTKPLTKSEVIKILKNRGFRRDPNNWEQYSAAKRLFSSVWEFPVNEWVIDYLGV